jgi:predicted Ser/Thr protein kinase
VLERFSPGMLLAGRYRLERELGRGGMAVVFQALDEKLGVPVAVKLLLPGAEPSHLALERLRREAAAYAQLDHPNIVKLHEFVLEPDTAFIAMELVEGPSLKQRILLEGRLPIEEVAEIGAQIASALDAAHRQGVIHRDIKPQNVLLAPGGRVKVVDFGLARVSSLAGMTATRTTIGTPEYMAPEQIQAQPVDPQADLYALGVLLYECLAGRPPFSGPDVFAVFQQHLSGTVRPLAELRPEVPAWLERVVTSCLQRRKEDRVRSAAAVCAALSGDDSPTLEQDLGAAHPALRKQRCPKCGGPAPEIVGFCLHCGVGEESVPRTVDALVVEDKRRWERENREMLQSVVQSLPGPLGARLQRRMELRQRQAIDQLEKHAKEVEKLREELELPVAQLSFEERAILLFSGRRRVQRWRRRKARVRGFLAPLGRWLASARRDGVWPALKRLPLWSLLAAGYTTAGTIGTAIGGAPEGIPVLFFIATLGFWSWGVHAAERRAGGAAALPAGPGQPGGLLGAERIERIRVLVRSRPSRRVLEPLARLLAALAQTARIANQHPDSIGAVLGDVAVPLGELVDMALSFGAKAALVESYLGREDQAELEAEVQRLEQRLLASDLRTAEDLGRLKDKQESVLIKRMDLDRQLEMLLARLSLTAAEAEDLLAALVRLSLAQSTGEKRQPSAILTDLRCQLEAMEELFPAV